jgi:hypothetical protein
LVSADVFEATCEICNVGVPLTPAEESARIGPDGAFLCDGCKPSPRRRRRRTNQQGREHGCIVTVLLADDELRSIYRDGLTFDALSEIVGTLPAGAVVLSISTPRTILRDLQGPWRRNGGNVDPYAVERHLLGKIGRTDLLPASAAPLFGRVDRRA